jgi:hypothetical protein
MYSIYLQFVVSSFWVPDVSKDEEFIGEKLISKISDFPQFSVLFAKQLNVASKVKEVIVVAW